MLPTGTSKPLTNTVEQRAARVAPVVSGSPAAQVALAALESPAVLAGPVARVVSGNPVAQVALVVLENPVVRVGLVAQAGLESPVVSESPAARAERVGLESPVVLVEPQPEQKLAVAGPALSPPRNRAEAAVALTVSEVINPLKAEGAAL